jgi:hypothetical protein
MEMLLLVVWPTKHQTLTQYGLTDENSAFPDNEAWHNLPALKPGTMYIYYNQLLSDFCK